MTRWLSFCFVAVTAGLGQDRTVVLSDCETLARWGGGVTLIADAKVGAGAVRFTMPDRAGVWSCSLDLREPPVALSTNWTLTFWYRLSGQGSSSLMLKVMDPVVSKGWQATWPILATTPADGQWHLASVDLASEFMQWGEKPDLNARNLQFRVDGRNLTLDLDQVALVPRLFTAAVGRVRWDAGRLTAELALSNVTPRPQTIVGGDLGRWTLAASEQRTVTVTVPVDAAWLAAAKPLEITQRAVLLQVADNPDSRKELTVTIAKPLDLPPHPRLLVSGAELAALQDRLARLPWAKATFDGEVKRADSLVGQPVTLPDRGSQWWHWYACKKDGGRLTTVSPTLHRCAVCGAEYSGWPWDDVVLDRIHGNYAGGLRALALVYRVTGDARYLAKAREILLAYAAQYTKYPLHNINGQEAVGGGRVGPQTLDESTWLIPMAQGADLIWEDLSPADREAAETGLFRPAAQVIRQHRMGIHNIQCWKNSAVGLVGLLLGDEELVADAVSSPHGFREQIAKGVNPDGQWYEGAWGYHFYTMSAIAPLVEAGQRFGLGLYEYEADGRRYGSLFDGPLSLAMPNLVLPAFNDSGTVNVKGSRLYELALARYGNPRYAAVLQGLNRGGLEALLSGLDNLPSPPTAAQGSRNYLAAGYAILEHGTVPDATWVCLKYGPHGGGHGHPDKLNLLLYRQGAILGRDPGTTAYGVPLQKEWYRASLAHNTLTVDETNQREATGECLAFGTQPGLSAALAGAGPIAEGVAYRRAVALIDEDLVLILDLVNADREHTFDLAWHNSGTWRTLPAGEAVKLPAKIGYQHLRNVVRTTAALPLIEASDKVTMGLAVGSESGETWAGRGFLPKDEDRPPCVIRRVQGRSAVVGWALHLAGQVPTVITRATADGGLVEVTVAGRTHRLTVQGGATPVLVESGDRRLAAAAP